MGEKSKLKAGRASAAGGWGQQSKLKAGQGGNPNRQAPLQAPQRQGYPAPPGQAPLAPLRVPDWQRQPATEKKTPPPETTGGGVREKTIS